MSFSDDVTTHRATLSAAQARLRTLERAISTMRQALSAYDAWGALSRTTTRPAQGTEATVAGVYRAELAGSASRTDAAWSTTIAASVAADLAAIQSDLTALGTIKTALDTEAGL